MLIGEIYLQLLWRIRVFVELVGHLRQLRISKFIYFKNINYCLMFPSSSWLIVVVLMVMLDVLEAWWIMPISMSLKRELRYSLFIRLNRSRRNVCFRNLLCLALQ